MKTNENKDVTKEVTKEKKDPAILKMEAMNKIEKDPENIKVSFIDISGRVISMTIKKAEKDDKPLNLDSIADYCLDKLYTLFLHKKKGMFTHFNFSQFDVVVTHKKEVLDTSNLSTGQYLELIGGSKFPKMRLTKDTIFRLENSFKERLIYAINAAKIVDVKDVKESIKTKEEQLKEVLN